MTTFIQQENASIAIGSRVCIQTQDGNSTVGTLKFHGETKFKKGAWVGVELDSPSGKHDGVVEGIRYFSCQPKHGLFVRPQMVKSVAMEEEQERKSMEENEEYWFDIQARAFIFNKGNSEWIELANGNTAAFLDRENQKLKLTLNDPQSGRVHIDHLVDVHTKIEKSIISQQSWVFRACRRIEPSVKDVLCLQFSSMSLANDFVRDFESRRASLNVKSTSKGQKNKIDNTGVAKTRVMRRRLTVSGSDPRLDGYKNGMMSDSPKSSKSSTPKALIGGEIGSWASGNVRIGSFCGVSRKGVASYNPRKSNQDSMILQQLPVNGYCNGELLLCVFDGHGENGHHVSAYFRTRLAKFLSSSPKFAQDECTGDVLVDALLRIENEIIQDRSVDTTLSGTTAVVTVLRGNKYFVVNVGDSRVIKGAACGNGSNQIKAHDLSEDHKPDLDKERKRIVGMGGRVFAMKYDDGIDGPARVWLSYADMPGLAMSRSLCDSVAKEAGVISNGEVFEYEILPGRDKCIVLATDGLWEFMSSQEVIDITTKHTDPRSAITELIKESNRRWRLEEPVIDDTTVIVAYISA